jgi:hypothetical protein
MNSIDEDEQWNEDGSVKNVRSKAKSRRGLANRIGHKATNEGHEQAESVIREDQCC